LSLVLLANLAVGWFLLSPLDNFFERLARQAVAGAGFVSNFLFLAQSGYFDAAAADKPLLHLWSLGIEEQFYIIWPLLLWAVSRFKGNFRTLIFAMGGASFLLNLYYSQGLSATSFYSPLCRFWELMIGGALAYFQPGRSPQLRSASGLLLILAGIVLIDKESAFPGWWALLPSLGAALLISAGPEAWVNRHIFSNRVMIWVGLISYPLYLWHWPALYWARLLPYPEPRQKTVAVAASLILSWATYGLVERKIRMRPASPRLVGGLCAALLGIGAFAFASAQFDLHKLGILRTLSPEAQQEFRELLRAEETGRAFQGARTLNRDLVGCFISATDGDTFSVLERNRCFEVQDATRPVVFLIGDSHSSSLGIGLRPFLKEKGFNMVQASLGMCEVTFNNPDPQWRIATWCNEVNERLLRKIAEIKPKVLVIDQHWIQASMPPWYFGGAYFWEDHLVSKVRQYQSLGAEHVILVGQVPAWADDLPRLLFHNFLARNELVPERTWVGVDKRAFYQDFKMRRLALPEGARYVSLKDLLCDQNGCLTRVGPGIEENLIVRDAHHLTASGASYVVRSVLGPAILEAAGHQGNR
jgi:peptidoglycan/LPS O-acetylase OafA/YrhL